MAYQLEETGDLTRTATVDVPAEEFESSVNRELRKLSKNVKIRGFRKGKIPLRVMRQRYGDSVRRDVIEDVVQKYLGEIVDETEAVLHISRPEVSEIPIDGNGKLRFTVDLELRPDIDPIGYLGVEVEKPTVEVTTEDLEEALEALREEHAEFEAVETRDVVQVSDFVTFDFNALGDDEELQQFQGDNARVQVGEGEAMPGIEDALIGAKFDSTVIATVTTGPDFGVPELKDRTFEVELTVKGAERRRLPELDDDFAKKTGKAETALELRSKVREELTAEQEQRAGHVAENNLMKTLLEQNPFELPPHFIDEQVENAVRQRLQGLQQQGLDLSQIDLDFDAFREGMRDERVEQLRSEFLLVAIAEKEKISVEDEDLEAHFEARAASMGVPADMLKKYMAEDGSRMQQAAASTLIEKTIALLLDKAEVVEGEWPVDEPEPEDESPSAESASNETAAEAEAKKSTEADASEYDVEAAQAAFEDQTVAELKDVLRDADLKVSGKKSELIDRLVEARIEP